MALPHVAILASPGMGHLTPMLELGKRFLGIHGFTATIITFSNFASDSQSSLLAALPAGLSSAVLPLIPLDDLPSDARPETVVSLMVQRSLDLISDTLQKLMTKPGIRLAVYVVDLFGVWTFGAARDLGVPHYLFFTTALMSLSHFLHLPDLDRSTSCEYRDLPDPVAFPGCVPVRGEDLLEPMQDRKNEAYSWVVDMGKRFAEARGIMVNSFVELEPDVAKALADVNTGWPPVYPVGPVVRDISPAADGFNCLDWLERQPAGSVLFVSFGSGGALSTEQTRELAAGLETSGHRFLWVLRGPPRDWEERAGGSFVGGESGEADPLDFLPPGFAERTRSVGLLVRSWAPQVEVLGHAAVGGFLSHCGWNSTLEGLVHGLPMIVWPLYAEQRLNAALLVVGVGVAIRPAVGPGGLVAREEVSRVVRELMEGGGGGEAARRRARGVRDAAGKALADGGSSHVAFTQLAAKW